MTTVCIVLQYLFICAGEPIDERGPVETTKYAAIHAEAPAFVEMSVEQEILATGIKVVDLLAPYVKGGKIGKHLQLLRYIQRCISRFSPITGVKCPYSRFWRRSRLAQFICIS